MYKKSRDSSARPRDVSGPRSCLVPGRLVPMPRLLLLVSIVEANERCIVGWRLKTTVEGHSQIPLTGRT